MPAHASKPTTAERRARRAALALIATVIACLHVFLPFRFPIPWPDETSFVAPAYELARHGTLYVWGMNPDRVVMWMPPAYFIALAALFKIFGYSFALVRWASAACVLAAAWVAGRLIETLAAGRLAVLLHALTAAAFLSPYVLMSGNIGRMEALLCLVMLASLAACVRGLPVLGAALVAGAATIHFNAVFFTLPAAAWFAWLLATRRGVAARWVELAGGGGGGLCAGRLRAAGPRQFRRFSGRYRLPAAPQAVLWPARPLAPALAAVSGRRPVPGRARRPPPRGRPGLLLPCTAPALFLWRRRAARSGTMAPRPSVSC